MYGDTTNVEYEIHDFVGNNWSHRNGNKSLNKIWKPYQKNIQYFPYKTSYTYLRNHTYYGKKCSLKLEAWALRITMMVGCPVSRCYVSI